MALAWLVHEVESGKASDEFVEVESGKASDEIVVDSTPWKSGISPRVRLR
jgi:hypothetical protein